MSHSHLHSLRSLGLMAILCVTVSSQAQEAVPPPTPTPSPMHGLRTENRYSSQPLWAANIAAEQRANREWQRLYPSHPLRPSASVSPSWNLPRYGRSVVYYAPIYWY